MRGLRAGLPEPGPFGLADLRWFSPRDRDGQSSVLVYDGDCGFCTTAATWAARRFRHGERAEAWQLLGDPGLTSLGLTRQDVEQAAATLGASEWQTFTRVILPALWPALLTGFALAFARGVGEYGSVIFIAGNMPMKSEIAPLLIITKLEQYDYAGATAIAVVMLVLSFGLMLGINALQSWALNRHRGI